METRKNRLRVMRPRLRDLFGQIIVTIQDVRDWLRAVPKIDPDSHRAAHYVKAYSVVDKIRQAKKSGTFDALVTDPPAPVGYWWHRFNWR